MINFSSAALAASCTLTAAVAGYVMKWRDEHIKLKTQFTEHKENSNKLFDVIKKELDAHELHDQQRHKELLEQNAATRKEIIDLLIKNQK